MASTRIIEAERGTYTGRPVHPHNGYYAGDFRTRLQSAAGPASSGDPATVRSQR